ncbi:endonuclease III domain-containing protein [Labrys neptuniae]
MPAIREQIQLGLDFGREEPIAVLRQRLLATYGPRRDARRHTPSEQFVKALISSETYDSASEKAFQALCEHFHPLDRLGQSDPRQVLTHLATVTHPEKKASQLVASVGRIVEQRGRFDLSHLAALSVEAGMELLQLYDGIGPKCAAAILNFSTLRRRVFVVDRHIKRFGERFGLFPQNVSLTKAHQIMLRLMPASWDADDLYELHWLIKRFGQEVCTSQRPLCPRCEMAALCRHGSTSMPRVPTR